MSLVRLVYYSAVIGGIAAFIGWLFSELLFGATFRDSTFGVMVIGAMIGAAIGVAINLVAGMANAQWKQLLLRVVPGLIAGGIGGAVGGLAGNLLFLLGVPRALGWLMMGLGIGVVDGVYEQSKSKIRNGLIGGALGGLVGGMLFDFILGLSSGTGMSGRATGFVILGLCIGALIGLAQVVLKDAWLTVLDGFRAGRQLILSQPVTALGRGDHLPLPFLGPMNKDIETEHLKIIRQPSGSFALEDNQSRLGTFLNSQPVGGQVPLSDGDVIKFGTNFVRFNERRRKSGEAAPAVAKPLQKEIRAAPPPPPAKKQPGAVSPSADRPKSAPPSKPASAPASKPPSSAGPQPTPPAKPSAPGSGRRGGPPPPPPPPRRKS